DGDIDLENKASLSTTGALDNAGFVDLDTGRGAGGSSLSIGGALTNSNELLIGNTRLSASDKVTGASLKHTRSDSYIQLEGFSGNQAVLDVTGSAGFGAAGVLSGYVLLAGDSAIEFKGGQITTIAAGSALELIDRDRGTPCDATPPTPPGVRVRTTAVRP